jgi:hypothetical protein
VSRPHACRALLLGDRRVARSALALAIAVLALSCTTQPPMHALVVRHPERKCALIKFSGCALLLPPEADADADGGADSE